MRFIHVLGFALVAGLAHAGPSEIKQSEAELGTTSNDKSEALSILDKFVSKNDLSDHNNQVVFEQLADSLLEFLNFKDTVLPQLTRSDSTFKYSQVISNLFCATGKDATQKNIAGVCMDGNFLWYTSADCSNKCKCNAAGEVHCDIPDDCGPQKDVVEFCLGNEEFRCSCFMGSGDGKTFEKREVRGAVEVGVGDNGPALAEAMDASFEENANIDSNQGQAQKPDIEGRPDQQGQGGNINGGPQQAQDGGIPMINPCFIDTICAGKTTNHWGDTFLMMPTTMATVTTTTKLTS